MVLLGKAMLVLWVWQLLAPAGVVWAPAPPCLGQLWLMAWMLQLRWAAKMAEGLSQRLRKRRWLEL